jgi:glyoxylase-like metal-dependent hydrolase (beta-lactamase superfamily II)
VLTGGGGNTAVLVGASAWWSWTRRTPGGAADLDKNQGAHAEAITTIINTHTHGDHVSGNVEFPATVEVVVHENTAVNMQEMRASTQTAPNGPAAEHLQGQQRPRHAEEDLQGSG